MKSLNKVLLMGHVGQDPELQISKGGKPYCRLRIATSQSWTNQDDKREQKTEWHSVFAWGNTAERCAQYLRSGALVFVEGSITHWVDSQQNEHKTAVHADQVKFLTYPTRGISTKSPESLDNPEGARNYDAVAHPA